MGWAAIANVGGSILGGIMGNRAARRAAQAQERAAREANQRLEGAQRANYSDLRDYRDMGTGSTRRLSGLLGIGGNESDPRFGELTRRFTMADYEADPGYQFRLSEGENAINRNALARGRFNSGAVLKELQGYNSNLASQEYGNAFDRWRAQSGDIYDRLMGGVQVGQRAVESGNADRSNITGQIANNITGIGNAQAAGRIAGTNALIGGLSGAADWVSGQNALNRNRPRRVSNYSPIYGDPFSGP